MSTMARRAYAGFAWQLGSLSVTALSSLLFMFIMGRLLGPDVFGQFAILTAILGATRVLTQFGFGPILVQKPSLDRADIETVFLLSMALALIASSALSLLAPLIARLFENRIDAAMIQIVALILFIGVAGTCSRFLLVRDLGFRALSLTDSVSYLLGTLLIGCVLAWHGWGIWSLLAGSLATTTIASLGLIWLRPPGLPRRLHSSRMPEVLRYSAGLALVQLLNQGALLLDKLLLGRLVQLSDLGAYERAQKIQLLPNTYLAGTVNNILFSVLSRKADNLDWLRQSFFSLTALALLIPAVIAIWLYIHADAVVGFLLGAQWQDSVQLLKLLAPLMLIQLYTQLADTLVRARDRFRLSLRIKAAFLLAMSGFTISGFYIAGFSGAVTGIVIAFAIHAVGMMWVCISITEASWLRLLRTLMPVLLLILLLLLKDSYIASLDRNEALSALTIIGSDVLIIVLCLLCPQILGQHNAAFVAARRRELLAIWKH